VSATAQTHYVVVIWHGQIFEMIEVTLGKHNLDGSVRMATLESCTTFNQSRTAVKCTENFFQLCD
jgi:hypothetical protein